MTNEEAYRLLDGVLGEIYDQVFYEYDPYEWTEEEYKALTMAIKILKNQPSAQPEIIRCKDCKWWDKYSEKHGYCMAAKHGFMSSHWEIGIYRIYDEDFFCADAEPKEKGGDDEAD